MESAVDLQNLTYGEIILRLLISGLIGAVIGYEREASGRPAGFRTNMLVGVGSCLMMVISIQIGLQYDGSDPSRIAAQVVSGVGFLGAGTIMVKGGDVKGLTTAATLWVNAGIGMAIGAGLYFAGIATGVIVLLALIVFGRLNFIQELDDDDDLPLEDEDEVSDDA